jgi:hypothetical protein
MESLNDALKKRLNTYHLNQVLSATQIVEAANRVLPPFSRAKTFKNEVLTVAISAPVDAYTFKQDIETHRERINAALGSDTVKQIRIRVTYQ